ncbi:MAG: hypothetical protein M0R17_01100 [Candidatus Omnitrophica bacterium]|jgi:hypothetical protein|nr:hypothetical protein [Candidatus Omnitrophota bacterium]
MKIKHFDFYRDCSTGGIEVQLDDGTEELYLVHGTNFGNDRIDVTKGGWDIQAIPTVKELHELVNALFYIKYDASLDYWKDEKSYIRNAYRLMGAIEVYKHYLVNTKDEIIPHVVEKHIDIENEIVMKMTEELESSLISNCLEKMNKKAINEINN